MKKMLCAFCVFGPLAALSATISIGDVEPAAADRNIQLSADDVLEVRGNGLTANCSITITGSGYQTTAKIKFLQTATIAAPIYVDDSVEFDVAENVTGTVAGLVTAVANTHGDAHVRSAVESGGLLRFAGGANFSGTQSSMYTTFRVLRGNVEIVARPFETTFSLSMMGGHLTIKDGGAWNAGTVNNAGLYLGRSDQSRDAIVEIGSGGVMKFGNNQNICLGYASGKLSKLYVNGGTLVTTSSDKLMLNYNQNNSAGGTGNAVFEIDNGGVVSNQFRVVIGGTTAEKSKIILGNGTWSAAKYEFPYLLTQLTTDQRACQISVTGDFAFDFAKFSNASISDRQDANGGVPALDVSWKVADGAKLTFNGKNGSTAASNMFFLHNFQPDGFVALGLKETNPINLHFVNAASALHFGASLPLATGTRILAEGTSPALEVDVDYADADATPDVLTSSVLSQAFGGFSSLSFGGAFSLSASADKILYVGPDVSSAFSSVKVNSGTLLLEDVAAISPDATFETAGEGALAFVDASGFDSDARMSGTKNLVDASGDLVVTDTPRTGAVVVGSGETLYVFGDGLGSAASVELAGGATLKFMTSATVAAPVVARSGNTNFRVAGTAVGTIAGKLTCPDSGAAHLQLMAANGTLNFIGGADIGNGGVAANAVPLTYFDIWSGLTQITNKPFDAKCALTVFQGSVRLADGGTWDPGSQQWAHVKIGAGASEQYAAACLEIGSGGYARIGNNCYGYVGDNSQTTYDAKLFLNGGTFYREGTDHFYLRGNGIIEIDNNGTFANRRQVEVSSTSGNAKVLLKNGTWNANNEQPGSCPYDSLFKQETAGTGNCSVSLEGDFTIDVSHYAGGWISNTVLGAATWSVKPGARLHVLGDSTGVATKKLNFCGFSGGGLVLDLNQTANTDVGFTDCAEPVHVSLLLPGRSSSRLQAFGATTDLELGLAVPEGMAWRLGAAPPASVVTTGFSSITYKDLVFDPGSTMEIPYSKADGAFPVAGTLTLPTAPEEMNYKVVRTGAVGRLDAAPIATADVLVGSPAWTCLGGVRPERATLAVDGNAIDLTYDAPGNFIVIR